VTCEVERDAKFSLSLTPRMAMAAWISPQKERKLEKKADINASRERDRAKPWAIILIFWGGNFEGEYAHTREESWIFEGCTFR